MAIVLGLLGVDTGHHPAAALVVDGDVVAFAEEDRFTGCKQGHVTFPLEATRFCLAQAGISTSDIDLIAYGWSCPRYRLELPLKMGRSVLAQRAFGRGKASMPRSGGKASLIRGGIFMAVHHPDWVEHRIRQAMTLISGHAACPPVRFFPHHESHAASTYFLSGMEGAAVLVADGSGEEQATSIWRGDGLRLEKLWSQDVPHSLGWFYSAFTEYLGFRHSRDEGKVMGLAAYGQASPRFTDVIDEILVPETDGGYRMDPSWGKFGHCSRGEHYADKTMDAFGPPRRPEAPLEDTHRNLAWAVQDRLEQALVGLSRKALTLADEDRLCLAGGVALNCKANGRLWSELRPSALFVQPASDDSGAALGAALLGAASLGDDPRSELRCAALGPDIPADEVLSTLKDCGLTYSEPSDLPGRVAELIAAGKVVAWAQGRQEIGPRALGQRSILARADDPAMADHVNQRVKRRESWRPYCPSMSESFAASLFEDAPELPFMNVAMSAGESADRRLGAVVHVDGSMRPQVVRAGVLPLYSALLEAVGRESSQEVVLNTSFNVRGQPVVRGPREALATFFSTGLDVLALGPFLLEK